MGKQEGRGEKSWSRVNSGLSGCAPTGVPPKMRPQVSDYWGPGESWSALRVCVCVFGSPSCSARDGKQDGAIGAA